MTRTVIGSALLSVDPSHRGQLRLTQPLYGDLTWMHEVVGFAAGGCRGVLRGAAAPVSLLSGCGSLGWGGWWWVPLVIPVVWCGSVPLGRPTPAAGFRPQLAVRRRSSRSRESAATVRERCVRSIRWLLGVEGALTDVGGGFEAPGFGSGVDGGDLGRGEPHRDGDVQPWRPSENNTNYACRKSAAPSRRWFRLMG